MEKRGEVDGKIDFRMNSQSILNLINSLSKPYAGAHVEIMNKKYKVWKAKIVKNYKAKNIEPGKIIKKNNNLLTIKTYDSAIKLTKHELILKKENKIFNMKIKKAVVISAHSDDETLGAGGTILKLKKRNTKVYWLQVTNSSGFGFNHSQIKKEKNK